VSSAHTLLHLIATYGYPGLLVAAFVAALGVGVPIPLTLLLLALGALSGSHGGPSFAALAVAGIVGVTGGHTMDYWLGRLGNRLATRWLARMQPSARVSGLLQGTARLRGGRAILTFTSRFLLTCIASPTSVFAGVTRMSVGLYLSLEVLGTSIYALSILALGRIFGSSLLTHGPAIPGFWVVVALATLVPLALVGLATHALGRSRPGIAAPAPERPAVAESTRPAPSVR
jgi:membrane protein DedA with SNARE-associated domain